MGYNAGWGLMILRIAVGIVFLIHGGQKLFIYGFAGVGASFAKMGIPMPEVMAVVVTLVEFLGGLALVLGLFTRWAALLLAINMLVAMFKVHFRAGFFLPQGFEFTFVLAAANLALALAGPGNLALERMLWRRR
jgi:putative oxidoreductase